MSNHPTLRRADGDVPSEAVADLYTLIPLGAKTNLRDVPPVARYPANKLIMIEAREARKLSGSYMSEKAAIDEVEKRIQDAALSGKWSVQVGSLTDFARSYLKQHEYKIIPNEHPDGGSLYTITWEVESQYR